MKRTRIQVITAGLLLCLLLAGTACSGRETDQTQTTAAASGQEEDQTRPDTDSPDQIKTQTRPAGGQDATETESDSEAKGTAGTEDSAETNLSAEMAEVSVIIVLDPGHDDKECCTNSHPDLDMYEQKLNLTIGLACRDRLQEYEGVNVYMTREDGTCPDQEYGGEECIRARTDLTARVDADLFVSLHCNGSTGVYGAEANGSEVYISGYPAFREDLTRLGEGILEELGKLDLADGGVRVRQKEEKGYYDDGTVKDWYYLISNNVDAGYPAIIIEHAYMDNAHDNAILKEEENLVAMGRGDADAIAAYFGLQLKNRVE